MRYTVRRLVPDDAAAYRVIRLEGLADAPSAFGASLEEDAALPEDEWRARLGRNFAYGVFDGPELGGIAGFYIEGGLKTKHRGHLVGVAAVPGRGLLLVPVALLVDLDLLDLDVLALGVVPVAMGVDAKAPFAVAVLLLVVGLVGLGRARLLTDALHFVEEVA